MNISIPDWLEKQNIYLKGFYAAIVILGISLFNNGLYSINIYITLIYFWVGYLINSTYTYINNARDDKCKSKLGHWWGEFVFLATYLLIMYLINSGLFKI